MHGTMKSMADLGLPIYGLRTDAGLTQVELAERLGRSQRYLSEMETGKPKVLNEKFFRVLEDLGIELTFRADDD